MRLTGIIVLCLVAACADDAVLPGSTTATGTGTGTGSAGGTPTGTLTDTGTATGGTTTNPCGPSAVPALEDCAVRMDVSTNNRYTELEYDACGRLSVQRDYDFSQNLSLLAEATYDAAGRQVLVELEYENQSTEIDGIVDWTYTSTYDAQGRIVERHIEELNIFGGEDCRQTYQYNGPDPYHDVYADGCDADNTWELTWQADGDPVSSEFYAGGGANPGNLREWIYPPGDDDHYERIQVGYQGVLSSITEVQWDGDNIIEERTDTGADGTIDRMVTYTYDAQDRLLELHSQLSGGYTPVIYTYTYTCN